MKVDKQKLRDNIEDILSYGIIEGEEIDITADKIMDEIEMLIKAIEYYDDKEARKNPF